MSFSLLIVIFLSYDCKKIKAYTSFRKTNKQTTLSVPENCLKVISASNSLAESLASLCTQFVINLSVGFAEVLFITILPEKK